MRRPAHRLFDFLEVAGELHAIAARQIGVEKKLALAPALDVDERDIAARLGLGFARVDDVNHQDLVAFDGELFQRGAPARRIEEIAHDHDETGLGKQVGEGVGGGAQIGFPAR